MKFLSRNLSNRCWLLLLYLDLCSQFSNTHYIEEYIDLFDIYNSRNAGLHWSTRDDTVTSLPYNSTTNRVRRQAIEENDNTNQNGKFLSNKSYGNCRAPNGEYGDCRPLLYCRIPELEKDLWRFVSQLCIIEQSSIGICCPYRERIRFSPQIINDKDDMGRYNKSGTVSLNLPNANYPTRRCGMTTRTFNEILGSRVAEPGEWPWMVALLLRGVPYVWCGGSVITNRHILTAAHCIHKKQKENIVVRLGEYDTLLVNETRARDFRIASMIIHIDYNPLTYENDIGLIKLERPTIFNTYIWPVCIPPVGINLNDVNAVVIGWGTQEFGGPHAPILMEVSLPIWDIENCRQTTIDYLPDTLLCAGSRAGGQDACQGDSGGPLMIQLTNRRWIVVGIVSWGIRCGEPHRPGMYVRVSSYVNWIYENTFRDNNDHT